MADRTKIKTMPVDVYIAPSGADPDNMDLWTELGYCENSKTRLYRRNKNKVKLHNGKGKIISEEYVLEVTLLETDFEKILRLEELSENDVDIQLINRTDSNNKYILKNFELDVAPDFNLSFDQPKRIRIEASRPIRKFSELLTAIEPPSGPNKYYFVKKDWTELIEFDPQTKLIRPIFTLQQLQAIDNLATEIALPIQIAPNEFFINDLWPSSNGKVENSFIINDRGEVLTKIINGRTSGGIYLATKSPGKNKYYFLYGNPISTKYYSSFYAIDEGLGEITIDSSNDIFAYDSYGHEAFRMIAENNIIFFVGEKNYMQLYSETDYSLIDSEYLYRYPDFDFYSDLTKILTLKQDTGNSIITLYDYDFSFTLSQIATINSRILGSSTNGYNYKAYNYFGIKHLIHFFQDRFIVFISYTDSSLWRFDLTDGSLSRISTKTFTNKYVTNWAKVDDKTLAVEYGDGNLYLYNIETMEENQIPELTGYIPIVKMYV